MKEISLTGRRLGKQAALEKMIHKALGKPGTVVAVVSMHETRIIKTVEGSHEIVKPELTGGGE